MGQTSALELWLDSLKDRIPVLTERLAGFYKENVIRCFDYHSHTIRTNLKAVYGDEIIFEVLWIEDTVKENLERAYGDLNKATEHAACAIALLLIRELTEFTAIEQSSIGTTIDYYLIPQQGDDTLIFNHAARLEISGILEENEKNTVDSRVKVKQKRLKTEYDMKDFIVIVEFSKPWSIMVEL